MAIETVNLLIGETWSLVSAAAAGPFKAEQGSGSDLIFFIGDNPPADGAEGIVRTLISFDSLTAKVWLRARKGIGRARVLRTVNVANQAEIVLGPVSLSATSFAASLAAGAEIATISGRTAGDKIESISPNDGRFVVSTDRTKILRGMTAVTPGKVELGIEMTHPFAPNSPRWTTIEVTIAAPPVIEPIIPGVLTLRTLDGAGNPVAPAALITTGEAINWRIGGRKANVAISIVSAPDGISISNAGDIADTRLVGTTAIKGSGEIVIDQVSTTGETLRSRFPVIASELAYTSFTTGGTVNLFGTNTDDGQPFPTQNHSPFMPWSISRGRDRTTLTRFALSRLGENWSGGSEHTNRSEIKNVVNLPFDTDLWFSTRLRFGGLRPPVLASGKQWFIFFQIHKDAEVGESTGSSPSVELGMRRRDDGTIVLKVQTRTAPQALHQTADVISTTHTQEIVLTEEQWHSLSWKIRIDADNPGTALLFMYLDGVSIVNVEGISIGYNDAVGHYFKYGMYLGSTDGSYGTAPEDTVQAIKPGHHMCWIEFDDIKIGTVNQEDSILRAPSPFAANQAPPMLISASETLNGWTVENGTLEVVDGPGIVGTKSVLISGEGVAGTVKARHVLGKYPPKKMGNALSLAIETLPNPVISSTETYDVYFAVKVAGEWRYYRSWDGVSNTFGLKTISGTGNRAIAAGTFKTHMRLASCNQYKTDANQTFVSGTIAALADGLYDVAIQYEISQLVAPFAQRLKVDAVAAAVEQAKAGWILFVDDSEGSWFKSFTELSGTLNGTRYDNLCPAEYLYRSGLKANFFFNPRGPISGPAADAQGIVWPKFWTDIAALPNSDPRYMTGSYVSGQAVNSKMTTANWQQLHDWNMPILAGTTQDVCSSQAAFQTPADTRFDAGEFMRGVLIQKGWVQPAINGCNNYDVYQMSGGGSPAALTNGASYEGPIAQCATVQSLGANTLELQAEVTGTAIKVGDMLIMARAQLLTVTAISGTTVTMSGIVPQGIRPAVFMDRAHPFALGMLREAMKTKFKMMRGTSAFGPLTLATNLGPHDAMFHHPSNSFSGTSQTGISGRLSAMTTQKRDMMEHTHGVYDANDNNSLGADILHWKAKIDAMRGAHNYGAGTIDNYTAAQFLAKVYGGQFPQPV